MSAESPETTAVRKPGPSAGVDGGTADSAAPAGDPSAGRPSIPARDMQAGWWFWLRAQLRHEPTHALTLAYLAVSLLGVWASYWFFRSFGIAILDYMDPSDYLTAGLRDPVYLAIVSGAAVLSLLLNFHEYARVRGEAYHAGIRAHWWGRLLLPFPYRPAREHWVQRFTGWRGLSLPTGMLFGVVWATMWLTLSYVEDKARTIMGGGGDIVRLTLAHTHEPQPGTARMLGTVGDFVFLYWPESRRAEAVSIENVGRLESVNRSRLAAQARTAKAPTATAVPAPSPAPGATTPPARQTRPAPAAH